MPLRTLTTRIPNPRTHPIRYAIAAIAASIAAAWLLCILALILFRFIEPPTTALQTERRIQSWSSPAPYKKHSTPIPLTEISLNLQHAVIAAEDTRFYQHHGFDWQAIELAAENDLDGGRLRGGSTLTQQLVKNLFFGTSRSLVRKAAEFTLVYPAEFILGKPRILELYLNTTELGPGIYGAEAASQSWYKTSARHLTRDQSARLAAILPAPRKRHPAAMNHYSSIVETRMTQMNW